VRKKQVKHDDTANEVYKSVIEDNLKLKMRGMLSQSEWTAGNSFAGVKKDALTKSFATGFTAAGAITLTGSTTNVKNEGSTESPLKLVMVGHGTTKRHPPSPMKKREERDEATTSYNDQGNSTFSGDVISH